MPGPQRISWHDLSKEGLPRGTTAVVNLAGQNILDMKQRWNAGFKQNVWNSRVNTCEALSRAIQRAKEKPQVYISMSGVGIYEPSETATYTEENPVREFDFLSKLCMHWEAAARLPVDVSAECRNVVIRSGVVLGRDGGMIQQLYTPFYLCLGGPIGSGQQFLPWIHVQDLTRLILFAIDNKSAFGVLNGVAPQPVTNKEFSDAFAKAMGRPAFIPVPAVVLRCLLSDERAKIMTEGQRVLPHRATQMHFQYHFPDIKSACKELVSH